MPFCLVYVTLVFGVFQCVMLYTGVPGALRCVTVEYTGSAAVLYRAVSARKGGKERIATGTLMNVRQSRVTRRKSARTYPALTDADVHPATPG